jgi:predicted CXXCH cytochrome family protein
MLLAEKIELCNECHDDIVELANGSSVRHSATTTKDECLNCHAPHAANDSPNLKKPERELCLGCHDKPLKSGESVLIDMKRWLSEHDVWHAAIRENGCTGCHQPHGSERPRLLEKAFPPQFYAKFELASYGLCFSCHEERMVTSKRSRTATGFRDGDQNLHFLHVNRAKKGRTCRACHDMHASSQPLQIRDRVRFGRWQMPLNFQKTETGGSCLPGCHQIRNYDREAPSPPGPP